MKKLSSAILIITAFFTITSCGKKKDNNTADASLLAKWYLTKAVYVNVNNGSISTQPFDAGSYLDFNKNGICYSFVDQATYSSNWKYIDNNTGIFIDNSSGFDVNDSGYVIKKLTVDSLQLLSKELISNSNQTLYLNK